MISKLYRIRQHSTWNVPEERLKAFKEQLEHIGIDCSERVPEEAIVTGEQLAALISFSVKQRDTQMQYLGYLNASSVEPLPTAFNDLDKEFAKLNSMSTHLTEKLKSMSEAVESFQNGFNQRCGQLQPSVLYQNIASVMLCEDCCTDALQKHLNEGWRILAIQPQPNQRRPDYILGHIKLPVLYNAAERG